MKKAVELVTELVNARQIEEVPETPLTTITGVIEDSMLVSIAISAKRIADTLGQIGTGDGMQGLHGFVMDLAYQAGTNFEAGKRRA